MPLHDVHAHLTHPRLLGQVDAVLVRARAAGVRTIISNGLNPADNAAVRALARANPDLVRAANGLYPVDAVLPEMRAAGVPYPRDEPVPPAEAALEDLRSNLDNIVAIGEIGLDHHWVPEPFWPRQEAVFRALVGLALEADLPIIIHTRKAERRALEVLQELGARRVCWHCFGGKVKLAREIAAAGHWLSIPANVRKSDAFKRMVQTLPPDRLLLETDCPYLGPEREQTNEPATVAGTAEHMAEVQRQPLAQVASQLAENFEALFGFAPG